MVAVPFKDPTLEAPQNLSSLSTHPCVCLYIYVDTLHRYIIIYMHTICITLTYTIWLETPLLWKTSMVPGRRPGGKDPGSKVNVIVRLRPPANEEEDSYGVSNT